jgi:Xaa-Pro aminopeptidase
MIETYSHRETAMHSNAKKALCCAPLLLIPTIAFAQVPATEYAARRAALMAPIDSGVVIAFGQVEPVTHWPPFFQHPDFMYLTGFSEADAALVMVKRNGAVTQMMFVPPRDPRAERYGGARNGAEELEQSIGIPGRLNDRLRPSIDSLARLGLPFYLVPDVESGDGASQDSLSVGRNFMRQVRQANPYLVMQPLNSGVARLRAKKSLAEMALLRRAVEISSRAHVEAMKAAGPGCGEWEIQALMEGVFRRMGGDRPGYGSIVASGPNALILHYDDDSRMMRNGELILIDAATSFDHYSADVTRTFPVNGRFTPAQRDIYQLVRDAQEAFVLAIKPGATSMQTTAAGRAVVTRGLIRLGLIEGDSATFDGPAWMRCPEAGCPQNSLYVFHGYGGHGIGLDVHDPAQYYGRGGSFQIGDVFTVEPGLYFSESLIKSLPDTPRNRAMLTKIGPAFEKYKGIGVRIEDDYALTESGLEWMSKDSPREIGEIESLMRERSAGLPGGGSCGEPAT